MSLAIVGIKSGGAYKGPGVSRGWQPWLWSSPRGAMVAGVVQQFLTRAVQGWAWGSQMHRMCDGYSYSRSVEAAGSSLWRTGCSPEM